MSTNTSTTMITSEDNKIADVTTINIVETAVTGESKPAEETIKIVKIKKSKVVNYTINEYVQEFISSIVIDASTKNIDVLEHWKGKENQDKLQLFIVQRKIKVKRPPKDGDEPRKPDSAFQLFSAEEKAKIEAENPDIEYEELTPLLAKRWQDLKLNEDAVASYVQKALEDKKRYDDELNRYKMAKLKQEKQEKLEKRLNKMKERTEQKVKKAMSRPKSAYFFFKNDEQIKIKTENDAITKKEMHLELQKRWKTLRTADPESVEKYKKIAEEKKNENPEPVVVEERPKKIKIKQEKQQQPKPPRVENNEAPERITSITSIIPPRVKRDKPNSFEKPKGKQAKDKTKYNKNKK
jgi:hypothetical protein